MNRYSRLPVLFLLTVSLMISGVSHASDTQSVPDFEEAPESLELNYSDPEEFCPEAREGWREQQEVLGVEIQADPQCDPDNPEVVAAVTKGTNKVPGETLMDTGLSEDAVKKGEDLDGDGDPDVINITLEVAELNGMNPSTGSLAASHEIAPGINPGYWVFAPKTRGMATEGSAASDIIRAPSPAIRAEEGDRINLKLENTHYMPHTIHFHGVDHPFVDSEGQGNDGVPYTSEKPVMPGESRTYEMTPEQAGTMFYHCHVQPSSHVLMGLNGMFVIEEERDNNTVQTFNIGNGKVRNPSKSVSEKYDQEYDMLYQGIDSEMHSIINRSNDPRVLSKMLNREYDVTERDPEYYTLNGKSFPYTARESQIVVEEGERVKARILNSGSESVSLHTHGHKPTITHYDGVEQKEPARIQRDVFDISAAQRVDLSINTTDNGLDSYGPGIWFMHDHREEAVTTEGISPGGDITLLTYEEFLGENGNPQTRGVEWDQLFTEEYYDRDVPVWANYDQDGIFGEIGYSSMNSSLLLTISLAAAVLGAMLALWYRDSSEEGDENEE